MARDNVGPDMMKAGIKSVPATYTNILNYPIGTTMRHSSGKLWKLTQKDKDYIKQMLNGGETARPKAEAQRKEALQDAQGVSYDAPASNETPAPAPAPAPEPVPASTSDLEGRVAKLEQQVAELLAKLGSAQSAPAPVAARPTTPAPVATPAQPAHPDLWSIPGSVAPLVPLLQNNW